MCAGAARVRGWLTEAIVSWTKRNDTCWVSTLIFRARPLRSSQTQFVQACGSTLCLPFGTYITVVMTVRSGPTPRRDATPRAGTWMRTRVTRAFGWGDTSRQLRPILRLFVLLCALLLCHSFYLRSHLTRSSVPTRGAPMSPSGPAEGSRSNNKYYTPPLYAALITRDVTEVGRSGSK